MLSVPLVMSYHTHIPEYIPRYTWSGLVQPMWSIIRWCTRRADLTLVTSKAMKVRGAQQKALTARRQVHNRGANVQGVQGGFVMVGQLAEGVVLGVLGWVERPTGDRLPFSLGTQ